MADVIFIPARAGSVGVKGKNKKLLNGIPLIDYTVDFAKRLTELCDIVVSTDDSEIFKMYKDDAEIICNDMRPDYLSGSEVQTKEVIAYELKKLDKTYKNLWLFQPTCPFREIKTFFKCSRFLEKNYTSVVTVRDVGGEHPMRMKRLIDERLINYVDTGKENMEPRQSLPPVFLRSGGIYGIAIDEFKKHGELVSDNCAGVVVMDREIINIDTLLDFRLAEILASEK